MIRVNFMSFKKLKLPCLTQPGVYSLILACGWTVVIAISLLLNRSVHHQETVTIALNVARAHIDKDILYRNWNSLHGGIYVPAASGQVSPFNHLSSSTVLEREVITPMGRRLVLVTPSFMTRQIYELAQKENKMSERIVSLDPSRPENLADAWEAASLRAFEHGGQEASSVTIEDQVRSLRLMRPLVTDKSCIPCHLKQKYKKGDIRGGISIKLPMTLFESATNRQVELLWAGHGIIWFLGLAGLYAGYRGLRRRNEERAQAEEELNRVNAILEHQATTDSLTGIYNRRKFLELLHEKIQEAKRYDISLALIFFDIDYFKLINDSYGHETGDNVLQELARIVTGMIRQTDVFARFGGEEFVLLVQNSEVGTGRELAEKIRSRIEHHKFPRIGSVTCSFGIATLYKGDSEESFLRRADDAMYAAKQAGKNRVEIGT